MGEETGEFQQLTAQEVPSSLRDPASDDKVTATEKDARHHPVFTMCTHMDKHTHACTHRVSREVIYACEVRANWSFCALSSVSFYLLFMASELC